MAKRSLAGELTGVSLAADGAGAGPDGAGDAARGCVRAGEAVRGM